MKTALYVLGTSSPEEVSSVSKLPKTITADSGLGVPTKYEMYLLDCQNFTLAGLQNLPRLYWNPSDFRETCQRYVKPDILIYVFTFVRGTCMS